MRLPLEEAVHHWHPQCVFWIETMAQQPAYVVIFTDCQSPNSFDLHHSHVMHLSSNMTAMEPMLSQSIPACYVFAFYLVNSLGFI